MSVRNTTVGCGLVVLTVLLSIRPVSAGARSSSWSRQPYVSLSSMASRYNFLSLRTADKQITLTGRFNVMTFEGDTRKAHFNNVLLWLNGPVAKKWGRWTILQCDADKIMTPLLSPDAFLERESYGLVVLDPGHGGEDKGTSDLRRGLEEKQLTLDLAQRVKAILQHYSIDVRLTRTSDRQVQLDDRCALAGSLGADLFVSLHLNSAHSSSSAGVETHIIPPAGYPITSSASVSESDRTVYPANQHDGANVILGYLLQKSLLKYTRAEDRGVRRSRFVVIKNVSCPSALVECGFISNRSEAARIQNPQYRDAIARGVAEGILCYLNTVKRAHHLNP